MVCNLKRTNSWTLGATLLQPNPSPSQPYPSPYPTPAPTYHICDKPLEGMAGTYNNGAETLTLSGNTITGVWGDAHSHRPNFSGTLNGNSGSVTFPDDRTYSFTFNDNPGESSQTVTGKRLGH